MKLGILAHGFLGWGGGVDFLRTVVDSLSIAAPARHVEIHLLIPSAGPREFLNAAAEAALNRRWRNILQIPYQDHRAALERFGDEYPGVQVHRLGSDQRSLRRTVAMLGIDCLLPAFSPLDQAGLPPWIGYLFDFQHRHFPDFFSPRNRRARDRRFQAMVDRAGTLMVNSRAVADDLRRFYPAYRGELISLPFAPAPNAAWFKQVPDVRPRYGIDAPYFLISNQFWVHKNHRCAFEAFAGLASRDELLLVCTGDVHDYRRPGYFGELQAFIRQLGIEARIRILGHIPKRDQIELMKHAIAVVQPTLFEGGPGGGATYDAVSLGVPVALSDIPVNREVDAGEVHYFPPDSPSALTQQLERLAASAALNTARPQAEVLLEAGRQRRLLLGNRLLDAVDRLVTVNKPRAARIS